MGTLNELKPHKVTIIVLVTSSHDRNTLIAALGDQDEREKTGDLRWRSEDELGSCFRLVP